MKINPDSPDSPRKIDRSSAPSKTGGSFADRLVSAGQPASPVISTQGISKQDLADPVKANAAIDRAVQELMEREFGGMCASDREHVTAWLRNDPIVRAALLQRLTSAV